ncbi:hypothetical protein FOPE_12528 [Fonsecaea pedrosoi]|nr:hypothetical protein FOPE_12528 [Fonsecaea pedrosoi]
MKLEWVSVKGVDLSGATKFLDSQLSQYSTEHLTVEIKILALQLEVFHTLLCLLLLAHAVSEAPRFTASGAVRNDMVISLEERPEQIIGNFTLRQQWNETFCGGFVPILESLNQQVESADTLPVGAIRFKLGEVVKQQALFDLSSVSDAVRPAPMGMTAGLSPPRLIQLTSWSTMRKMSRSSSEFTSM